MFCGTKSDIVEYEFDFVPTGAKPLTIKNYDGKGSIKTQSITPNKKVSVYAAPPEGMTIFSWALNDGEREYANVNPLVITTDDQYMTLEAKFINIGKKAYISGIAPSKTAMG